MTIISVGEILWDVIGNTEHLGGAAFNFAAHASRLGHAVSFVSAVGGDERGRRALEMMAALGLSTHYVQSLEDAPTGVVAVSLDAAGQPHFTIHHPAAYESVQLTDGQIAELVSQRPDWIYFGTLFQMSPQARRLTSTLIDSDCGARRFYDVNLRKDSYEPNLVCELMSHATVVKFNEEEAALIGDMVGQPACPLEEFCRSAARKYGWEAVCVTRAEKGCVLLADGEYVVASGYAVQVRDTVGAGDAFAAALVHGLTCRWSPAKIADFANRVAALVASRPGAIPPWTTSEALSLTRQAWGSPDTVPRPVS